MTDQTNRIQTTVATETTPPPAPELASPESKGELVPVAMEVQDPDNIVPVRPDFLTDAEDAEIKQQAEALVAAILENPSDVEITAQVYGIGTPAMQGNTRKVNLMDEKIGPVMAEITVDNPVQKSIVQIKAQLDLVNPHVVASTQSEFEGRFLGLFKRVIKRLPNDEEIMVMINKRKDSVDETVDALKQHLWTERDKALRNAVELGMIANDLFASQEDLMRAAYQGQLVWAGLNEARDNETDPVRMQALTYLTNDLSTMVVDVQTVDQLNMQSRLGAENLINNCRQIEKLVARVTNILLPAVKNALMVRAAAAQQAQLVGSAAQIMESASSTIHQTAKDVRQTVVRTAQMNSEALVNISALEEACNEYDAAQAELLTIFETSEATARGISNKLTDLNARMREHADPLTRARQAKDAAGV